MMFPIGNITSRGGLTESNAPDREQPLRCRWPGLRDIGGVRVVLDTQKQVDAVAAGLRRNWRSRIVEIDDYSRQAKSSRSVSDVAEYPGEDYDRAQDDYRTAEREHADDPGVEVVLLSADSIESVMSTHGRFFVQSRKHVDDWITERLDELLGDSTRQPA
jgi:hypothetical protein